MTRVFTELDDAALKRLDEWRELASEQLDLPKTMRRSQAIRHILTEFLATET